MLLRIIARSGEKLLPDSSPLAPPTGLKNQEDEKNADAFFDSGAHVMPLYYLKWIIRYRVVFI